MKPKLFPHNIRIRLAQLIFFLNYEESLVSSNLNSKQLRFHCVRPNVHTKELIIFREEIYPIAHCTTRIFV